MSCTILYSENKDNIVDIIDSFKNRCTEKIKIVAQEYTKNFMYSI